MIDAHLTSREDIPAPWATFVLGAALGALIVAALVYAAHM